MELLKREDYEKILNENDVMLVIFYATWCPPCKMLKPIVLEYMENHPDDMILTVNVDNIKDIHKQYNIRNVPMILSFKKGVYQETYDGYLEYEEIEEIFDDLKA